MAGRSRLLGNSGKTQTKKINRTKLMNWNYKFATDNPVYFAHLFLSYFKPLEGKMLQTSVDEEKFVAEKLSIPQPLPKILKEYTKAAIRTQPYDLLKWSAAYFTALAEEEIPPVKERLEFPPVESNSGLTPGYLKLLHKQIGATNDEVSKEYLGKKWSDISLKESALDDFIKLLNPSEDENASIKWINFVAVAAGHITQSPLQTMVQVCEVLTKELEGASACIPMSVFAPLYDLVSKLDVSEVPGIGAAVPPEVQAAAIEHLNAVAEEQAGNVTPRNLGHFTCPKLY